MRKEIIADVNPHEARIALLEDGELAEVQVELRGRERIVGNIYKGRVANILPGMQAAFVDMGLEKNAFLYAGDILVDKSDFEFEHKENEKEEIEGKLKIPNIQDILKPGQEIMLQVLKQPGGNKGARVTTHITLPGRRLVLMPTVDHIGVSRRIEDEEERERLKNILSEIKPKGMGLIVRTAAVGGQKEDFEPEINFLVRLWEKIQSKADFLSAPRLIHSEETLLFRTVRDMFTEDVDRFLISDKDYYEKVVAVANITTPGMKDRISYYESDSNIFDDFGIESKLDKAMQRKVWLKSGCYLVIDETEALTVIDVNTGKYIGENDLQETIVNANIEAATEIARQLRIRDISGIIVIDFIDMESEENKHRVVEALEQALKRDRTKSNVLGITSLGLVEMTRKKVRRKLSTLLQVTCPCCDGRGKVYSKQAMSLRVRREIARRIEKGTKQTFVVETHPSIARYIIEKNNSNQAVLDAYENKKFYIVANKDIPYEQINITQVVDKKDLDQLIHDAQVFC